MEQEELIERAKTIFEREPRLIELPSRGMAVFVGDTHGDLDASEQVIRRFLEKDHIVVFLGDYVDRGALSRENIHYLLRQKLEHPGEIFLLAGNHEGYEVKQFSPAHFWDSLSIKEREVYGLLFSQFPLAATSPNGILALHGGLPELNSLSEINEIEWGDAHWERVVWGDFVENGGDVLGDWAGRPQLGRDYFGRMMAGYQKQVLIRSHQPHSPRFMFGKRCVTVFTSHAYKSIRTVVIADLGREIRTGEDVVFEKI